MKFREEILKDFLGFFKNLKFKVKKKKGQKIVALIFSFF